MGATTVTGTILGVDNDPIVGAYITFRLKSVGTDSVATSTIDQDSISIITDASGQFTQVLWDNGDSGIESIMEIKMPSGQRVDVIIPAGDAAIDIWDLIENYQVGTADPQLPTNEALFMRKANDLSDVADVPTARSNLGLGTAALTASTDYATAAQGTTADAALPKTGGAMTGAITTNSTFDGRDVATDGTKLDGIEPLADVTDEDSILAAGAYIVGGTDVAIADGGTGASTEAIARTNLEFQTNVTGPVTEVTVTSYTVLITDHTLTVDDTAIGGNVTINLEAVAIVGNGFELKVKKTGNTFDVTIDGSGAETIDGLTTQTLTIENQSITIVSNGTGWDVTEGQGTGSADSVVISAVVNEAAGITKGQVVYISGATGGEAQVSLADNTVFSEADVIAVARDTQADTETITVVTEGLLGNIDTSAFAEGDILYLGTAGSLTATHPTGIDAVQRVGHAVNIDATEGTMLVSVNPLTIIDDLDGTTRFQIVNENAGTASASSFTLVNDEGYRASVSLFGDNTFEPSAVTFYNQGYGLTAYTVDGNQPHIWLTDATDTHNFVSTEKMRLSPEGYLGIGTTTPAQELHIEGAACLEHTAVAPDEHGLEIIVDAAGFGDVKGLDIDYITGAIGAGEDEGIILVNIDETASTGGDVYAFEVLSTTLGSDAVTAVKTGVGVAPIGQLSGAFGDVDTVLNLAVDVTAAVAVGGAGNITMFVADNDTITIGDAGEFSELEFILDTGGSQNINPTFEYSTGVGTWAAFTPTDGTNGFLNTGAMLWNADDLAGWAVGAGSEYLIRITRTRNALSTAPIVDVVQFANPDAYSWDKDGKVTIDQLSVLSIPVYADDTAAGVGGLVPGDVYQHDGTGGTTAGNLMVKQ